MGGIDWPRVNSSMGCWVVKVAQLQARYSLLRWANLINWVSYHLASIKISLILGRGSHKLKEQ